MFHKIFYAVFYALCTVCVFHILFLLKVVKFLSWYDCNLLFNYQKLLLLDQYLIKLYSIKERLFDFVRFPLLLNLKI